MESKLPGITKPFSVSIFFRRYLFVWISLPIVILFSCKNSQNYKFTLTNPLDIYRPDEMVVLKRSDIEKRTGHIPDGSFVLIGVDNNPVEVQYDDLDGDKKWDELAFLYSFGPYELKNFSIKISDHIPEMNQKVKAHVRHRKKNTDDHFGPVVLDDTMPTGNPPTDFTKVKLPPYLTEGPAWENDKVAFRLYFDTRNGKDIFGKLIPGMVMDTIGADYNNSYHELSQWGMDILHVGKSLGAGSVALEMKNDNGIDTLVRLGGSMVKSETYKVIADGPVRAIFRVQYDCEYERQKIQIIDETSIWGGQYFYDTRLYIKHAPAGCKLVAGFADFYNNTPGYIDTLGTQIFYSYGSQSENKDDLGLAIEIDSSYFAGYKKTTDTTGDILNSYLVAQRISADNPVSYRFYSGWSRSDKQFSNQINFDTFLRKQALFKAHPILIDFR